jgi:hypothetical protein
VSGGGVAFKIFLECPKCKGPMRVTALIEDGGVILRILEHLGGATGDTMQSTTGSRRLASARQPAAQLLFGFQCCLSVARASALDLPRLVTVWFAATPVADRTIRRRYKVSVARNAGNGRIKEPAHL